MLSSAERSCASSAIGCVSTSNCPPSAITCAFCECGFVASNASACCFASANRVPARMLKESSNTISSKRPFAPAAGRRTNGSANASTTSSNKAIRRAKSSKYRNRRCRVELCVPRSKNMSELTGRGMVTCFRSRCTKTGTPSAARPPRNHGARKPISSPPAAAKDTRATLHQEVDRSRAVDSPSPLPACVSEAARCAPPSSLDKSSSYTRE